MNFSLTAGGRRIDLSTPLCMGVINTTPDSFSDGAELACSAEKGFVVDIDKALRRAELFVEQGASIIDIGGESTRPGAIRVSSEEEINRVVPLVEAVKRRLDVCISVDTSSAKVIKEAINAGAEIINDIRALSSPEALGLVAESQAAVCVMHMQGQPHTMQHNFQYSDVVQDVYSFLQSKVAVCKCAGIRSDRLIVDVGFGFGKSLQNNYQLLKELAYFRSLNLPILVGISRKSMIGEVVKRPTQKRVPGSIAATVLALENGANIVRTHDVAATVDAIRVHSAYSQG